MKKILTLALLGLLSACAQQMIWDKPGATQADFNRDDYACRKDAIAAGGTTYYGWGVTGRNADTDMYRRCMVASGYSLRQGGDQGGGQALRNNSEAESALRAIRERQEAACADPKFAPYYSKTACTSGKITFEQLADSTRISPAVKAIFVELRNTVDASNSAYADLIRKYGGSVGAKRADLFMSTAKVQNDRNNLDLFNGTITWGEYNKRRQQIQADFAEAEKKITQ
jgi:hypothetical protein